jgi:hypothetical protein
MPSLRSSVSTARHCYAENFFSSRNIDLASYKLSGIIGCSEALPVLRIDVSLVQNTPGSTHWDFMFPGDYRGVSSIGFDARKLDVTTLLAYLLKAGGFETPLDFAER